MGKGFVRQGLAAGAAATLAVGCALAAAAPASADQVWHQGVGRASSDAACPGDNASELAQGWSKWTPSWAQWMNDGRGGWVCERAIRWARDAAPGASSSSGGSGSGGGSSDCIDAGAYGYFSGADFESGTEFGEWLPTSSDVFSDSACGSSSGTTGEKVFVLASSSDDAGAECVHHGQPGVLGQVAGGDSRLYECRMD